MNRVLLGCQRLLFEHGRSRQFSISMMPKHTLILCKRDVGCCLDELCVHIRFVFNLAKITLVTSHTEGEFIAVKKNALQFCWCVI